MCQKPNGKIFGSDLGDASHKPSREIPAKTLTSRLFAILSTVSFLSFFVATAISAYVSWTAYEGDAEERLAAQLDATAEQLAGKSPESMATVLANVVLADTRITLVAPDGVVLFDNLVDIQTLENHGKRQEIQAARQQGEAVVLRTSETTGTDSLYAATRLDDEGSVLRLSQVRTSLAFYLRGLVMPLVVALAAAAFLAALFARALTRRVIAPLVQVNLDVPQKSGTYREIAPLLDRIYDQRWELLRQNHQLEQVADMRREFTGNVSHEMKSPLQVIGGYAELIEGGFASPEDARRFAGLIRSESQSMRELIDDVLMLSRLDEGAYGEQQMVSLSPVVNRVSQRLAPTAEAQDVTVALKLEEDVRVWGSEKLLEQAIYNLVDNAIRYGNAHVLVEVHGEGKSAKVTVSDDGAGVPCDQRQRIFERFYRLDPSRSRSTGGTGLGLAIAKHVAESLGGCIFVDDADLGGARFALDLPRANGDL